jgi:hypothetical protein
MKTEKQSKETKQQSKVAWKELFLSALMFILLVVALLGGAELIGLLELPARMQSYLGAALIAYVFVSGIVVTYLSAKQMLIKKG